MVAHPVSTVLFLALPGEKVPQPTLADRIGTGGELVTAEHAGDLSTLFLDIHQPGTIDVIDHKTKDQPHGQVMIEMHLLGGLE